MEAELTAANATARTISSLGLTIDVSGVVIRTAGGIPLSVADLVGAPMPGMTSPGYVGGTVFADFVLTAASLVATSVTVTMPETVLIGDVTQNDPGGPLEGRTFSIMGVPVRAANDPRLDPFAAVFNALPLDIASVIPGTLAAAEGYFGDDGVFYATLLEADAGIVAGGPQVAIERASCKAGELEVRGAASLTTGTVEIINEAGGVIGSSAVDPADGTYRVRVRGITCPPVVRARHQPSGALSDPFAPATR